MTAGSFEVNGVAVAVLASDTLNDVLDRIDASAAGVTASFDALSESVVLTQDTPGPGATIAVGNDDSGFLAATKLAGATPVPGEDSDLERVLDDVPELAGIASGSFFVDGVAILVDTSVDSLQGLFDRIAAQVPGVEASYDAATGKVSVESTVSGEDLVLDDGTSGFFSALGIAIGTLEPESKGYTAPKRKFQDDGELRRGLVALVDAVSELFGESYSGIATFEATLTRNGLRDAARQAFEGLAPDPNADFLRSGLGLQLDFADDRGRLLQLDQAELSRAASKQAADLADFLVAEEAGDGRDGLLTGFVSAIDAAVERVRARVDADASPGLFVSLNA